MPPCLDTPICSDMPPIWMLPCPHMFKHSPYVPNAPLCICMFWGVSACDWGCGVLLLFGHPHVFGCLPMCPTPQHIYMLPCMSVCSRGYCMCYGETSHMLGAGGLWHICQAFGVCQYIHWMSIMLHLVPFL